MKSAFRYDTRQLGRRAGSMREERIDVAAPEGWGLDLVSVPAGTPVVIDARFEAVMDGVLVTATVELAVSTECGRCLDPVELQLRVPVQELYGYQPDPEDDEALTLEGDILDLEPAVRDAVVLGLPLNPLCDPDCEGLCPTCGVRMADVEPDHGHDEVDPRWAALALLKEPDEESGLTSNNEEN
ncbi:MAG TPA: YceD family protein [Mycobacteriales bacterium]|nr:YceD family protein [Mycobacteriales bacterium]